MFVFQFICLTISLVATSARSVGSESESLLTCSKFDFEEKVLEKVIRLEHKVEVYTEKMRLWEESFSSSLDKVTEANKLTETFVGAMRNAHIQDQIRFNDSFLEAVNHFKIQSENETRIFESKMNSVFDSLSSKIQELIKDENKRKNAMNLTLQRQQSEFNGSFERIVEHFEDRLNNSLQKIEYKQPQVGFTSCANSAHTYSVGSFIKFPDVSSKIGISNMATFTSTGKFICTAAGLYQISVTILSNTGDRFGIYMNKHVVSKAYISSTSNHESGTCVAVVVLKRNDEVSVQSMYGNLYVDRYASCITIVKL